MPAIAILICILLAGVLAAMVVFLIRHKRAKDHKEQRRAAERVRRVRDLGWHYDPTRDGDIWYRFRSASPHGIPWHMHYDSNHGSSSAHPKLVWRADTLAAARVELAIGSRRMYEALNKGIARKLLSGAAFVFGRYGDGVLKDMNEFLQEARAHNAGSARFRKLFVVVARDSRHAGVVDADTERLVLDWPRAEGGKLDPEQAVQVWLDRTGLHAQVQVDAPPMAICEHLARLGESIADRLGATLAR